MKTFQSFSPTDTYHEATKHSWLSVRQRSGGLDWSTQPSVYKNYPADLPRVSLLEADPLKRFLYRVAGITAKKSYPGVEYYLRTNPSAGALYPNEVYFQARGVKGFPDGIYHLEVASSSAVLLRPIDESEGLEAALEDPRRRRGLLLFVSGIYWRSSWKYRDRAFRYVLLDAGHLLGSAETGALLWERAYTIRYRIDREGLNRFFGFGREEGMLSAFDMSAPEEAEVRLPDGSLEQVDPTGSFEPDERIEAAYRASGHLRGCREEYRVPQLPFAREAWAEAILQRRSIRQFSRRSISKEEFTQIVRWAQASVPSDCDEPVELYAVVNRVEGMEPGLVKEGEYLKRGDLSGKAGYLCLEQALGSESAVTFFLVSSGENYAPLYQKAGLMGHRLYLAAEVQGIGASGIGAYYDDEVREFLGTEGKILYAFAIGR
ncbi:MAG TPA: dehydrogenase [Nitratifractor salsuginis]|uniref:Dehydrogenase n=1 Tax=Nitratifractor salsuginis TaxID=269261 RepID=A0A7V2SIL8_9BACT|nr:dehydrogenase [Nitratifractor salsuginis]